MRQTLNNSWKFLTAKLHQPLPFNRRDSQKLLTLLNDSFKRNLDRQYPPGLADAEHSPDDHFHSLLKSPLFNVGRVRRPSIAGRKNEIRQDATQLRDLMLAVKEPVEYFRQQVATGAASMASAKLALENQMKNALASASVDTREGIKSSEMGSVVVNWLWSSGQYERLEFMNDRDFVARLMPFVVAEGQYKPVWEWLQRSQYIPVSGKEAWTALQKDIGFTVKKLVQSEISYGHGLQSATQMFLTNLKSIRPPSPGSPLYNSTRNHYLAGTYLTSDLAFQGASSGVEERVLDDFERSIGLWVSHHLVTPYGALIQLLHPEKPKDLPAAQLISTIESSKTQFSKNKRLALIPIGLKAVEILLNHDSEKEAAQVMKTMQLAFASELAIDNKSPVDNKDDEEAALRSLNLMLTT